MLSSNPEIIIRVRSPIQGCPVDNWPQMFVGRFDELTRDGRLETVYIKFDSEKEPIEYKPFEPNQYFIGTIKGHEVLISDWVPTESFMKAFPWLKDTDTVVCEIGPVSMEEYGRSVAYNLFDWEPSDGRQMYDHIYKSIGMKDPREDTTIYDWEWEESGWADR